MRTYFFCLQLILLWQVASAQNMGFGTSAPMARLHIVNNLETFRLQGQTHYLGFYNNAGTYTGYLWNRNNNTMDLGTPAGSNFPVTISPSNIPLNTFLFDGSVGIGNINPLYRLDVSGRIRLRHATQSAGIWFNNASNTIHPAFIGLHNDNYVGLYGNNSGWGLLSNTVSGHTAVGADPNASGLFLQSNTGSALEIAGGIKVSGSTPAAFRLIAGTSNLADVDYDMYRSVIIDYPLSNNDPNAILLVTPVQFEVQVNLKVVYDEARSKWKITTTSRRGLKQAKNAGMGIRCTPRPDDPLVYDCVAMNHLIEDEPWGFQSGNTFNVLIIKQ